MLRHETEADRGFRIEVRDWLARNHLPALITEWNDDE
jgi:hypothetical protein